MKEDTGYYEMYGAAIKLAINDYCLYHKNEKSRLRKIAKYNKRRKELRNIDICRCTHLKTEQRWYETATMYLFSPRGLEAQLKRIGLEEILSIDYIRRQAALHATAGLL